MHVITRTRLREHWEQRGREDSEDPLKAWLTEARKAKWQTPADVKQKFGSASFLADNRIVFNIAGNKYRLVVHVNYEQGVIFVKFVGTHEEYDDIDPLTVGGGGAR